ncbi:unnamed protein product [Cyprideis torosa]|uniref:Uncharacterized protein n=1 Tax=Cyprideis torosa TaxID=163714 RepID=A0A7R8ZRI4_9CRUS|nr:unnamed protein product [Cyprideis torosa]CAG0893151.1 unnamed protein product [Cyprideis torosa]
MSVEKGREDSIATKTKTLHYCDKEEAILLRIPEALHADHGMFTWPSSLILGQFIWKNRRDFVGKNILELGAGTAIPGILAAKIGAKRVYLSDNLAVLHVLRNLSQCTLANDLSSSEVEVLGIKWGLYSSQIHSLRDLDFVLGADTLFDPSVFEDFLATFACLLLNSPFSTLITVYEIRSPDWTISSLLYKWKLNCVVIPLSSFDCEPQLIESYGKELEAFKVLKISPK